MNGTPSYDLAPVLAMAGFALLLAAAPLAWWWRRHRDARPAERLRALTLVTLFLTFDLVLVGAFTRLSDSGLGCPDWPGCYGQASPLGAHAEIHAAQSAMPTGPVTHGKAWVEMVHRYLASGVGMLAAALMVASWVAHRRARAAGAASTSVSPWWATLTFAAFCLQGAFGAWTVTWKLYPAIVTAHLLGGLALLALLAAQSQAYVRMPLALPRGTHAVLRLLALLALVQITLGGWVSTNYAVLACTDFPTCQGRWWPSAEFAQGFTVLRPLGLDAGGQPIAFAALTAIHLAHRIGALVVLAALLLLAWRLAASGEPAQRRWAAALGGVALWQFASGLGNVVLGWPLAAALAHTAGAAVLVVLLSTLLVRAHRAARAPQGAAQAALGTAS